MKRHRFCLFSIETEQEICKLYQKNVMNNCVSLSKKFGCRPSTIYNILKAYKIPTRSYAQSQKGLQIGIRHPNYKGGNISQSGYKRMYIDRGGRRELIFEHRYLMELQIGRKLTRDEVVHHINGDKLDNSIENLQLMTRSEHALHHMPERATNEVGWLI